MNALGFVAGVVGMFFIAAGFLAAWRDGFATVAQMRAKGIERGLPWLWHGGMIGDIVVITPMFAYIASQHGESWDAITFMLVIIVCFIVAVFLGKLWDHSATIPESHTHYGNRTLAGSIHILYVMLVLPAIVMFYFFTPKNQITSVEVATVSCLLGLHTFIGTHTHLKILVRLGVRWFDWYGVPFRAIDLAPVGGVCALLAWRWSAIVHG